jgi:tetratricopeptide (TPR) repeat protein
VADLAKNARLLEDIGAYGRAVEALRLLRGRVAPDADLELALALDEARADQPDSALARFEGRVLTRALTDSLPLGRRHVYPWEREKVWTNGRFDGWHWYVARGLAEVNLSLGRWREARAAAEICAQARPTAGSEWLLLAITEAHPGDAANLSESEQAATTAVALDPTLPEAHYLAGLFAWRHGRRIEAQQDFRAAVALDSTSRAPAIALVRAGLPGAAPDSLPATFLTGVRRVGMLTSALGPKIEEFVQMDSPASILKREILPLPDSVTRSLPAIELTLPILVDERGRAVLHELPWYDPSVLPAAVVASIVGSLPDWRFRPAMKMGEPHRVWAAVSIKNGTP